MLSALPDLQVDVNKPLSRRSQLCEAFEGLLPPGSGEREAGETGTQGTLVLSTPAIETVRSVIDSAIGTAGDETRVVFGDDDAGGDGV